MAHTGSRAVARWRAISMLVVLALVTACGASTLEAAERQVTAPGGALTATVSDGAGLRFRIEVDGQTVLTDSSLGLSFADGTTFGPAASIVSSEESENDSAWENRFGNRRFVRDRWRELRLTLQEQERTFGLIVRAYDDGIAFRYDLPEASGLGDFVLTKELTEFRFADDFRCWAGGESICAENEYPEMTLSAIPSGKPDEPFRSVLPLLVESPVGYLAVAESDLLDWSGMSLTGTGTAAVKVLLDTRLDGNGLVASSAPRVSPWRVLMFGRTPGELVSSDLIASLATPSRLDDVSWIVPGACAWDVWWTGINPFDPNPRHRNLFARGTTASHKQYIDLAAEMGWRYQLIDWLWHEPVDADNPQFKPVPEVDIPELMDYAKSKNVHLLIWLHQNDTKTVGVEKTLSYVAEQGFAGVKLDFLNNQSQETVQWCEQVLAAAAERHLLVNIHGMYKPTGLARTYPNFITQEGVLGNEYNKLPGDRCTPLHTVTLPFTRGLLGPMDFTPGGFLNRSPEEFSITTPTQVMGTRARQLAMTIVYCSPLLVLCDSPENYRGQPGVEFLRDIPTVWDESVVIAGEVGRSIVIARRSGDRWYLAAMNADNAAQMEVPLAGFLGEGQWTLRSFADDPEGSDPQAVIESTREVDATTVLPLTLVPAGGFAGILSPPQ